MLLTSIYSLSKSIQDWGYSSRFSSYSISGYALVSFFVAQGIYESIRIKLIGILSLFVSLLVVITYIFPSFISNYILFIGQVRSESIQKYILSIPQSFMFLSSQLSVELIDSITLCFIYYPHNIKPI